MDSTYTLAELKDVDADAFEKACMKLSEIACHYIQDMSDDFDWWKDNYAEHGIGLEVDEVTYDIHSDLSVPWHIFDYKLFLAKMTKDLDLKGGKLMRARILLENHDGINWERNRRWRGGTALNGSVYTDFYVNIDNNPSDKRITQLLDDYIYQVNDEICSAMLKSVKANYDQCYDEDYLIEMSEANDDQFTIGGEFA